MHVEDPRDRDIRLRQQLLIDEERKLAATTAKDYKEKFASDYPKAIAIIYALVSETIRKDLSRAVENAVPAITNNEAKYRKIRERLQDKWGPNSQKDAEELRRKLTNLQGDARGWDIYLIALDDITQVLAKTVKRDSANNPLLEPVPLRPPLPRPPINSTLAGFQAHFAADLANEIAWDALHPAGAFQNHKPTDDAIKNIVIMALADSQHECYSSMANRYRQTDHANKTWSELRADIESMIQNNRKGPGYLPRSPQPPNHLRRRLPTPAEVHPRCLRHQPQLLRPIPAVRTHLLPQRRKTTSKLQPSRVIPTQTKHQPVSKPPQLRQLRRRPRRTRLRQPHLQQMPGNLPFSCAAPSPLPRRTCSCQNHRPGLVHPAQTDQVQHQSQHPSNVPIHATQRRVNPNRPLIQPTSSARLARPGPR